MRKVFFALLTISFQIAIAQNSDSIQNFTLPNVTVTTFKEKTIKESSLNITSIAMDSNGNNFNLTDLLARTPGVQMLSTGVAIAKPVVRGLYGNRVLVLISGSKFDNQQWQEEHGLGLSDIGLSKVELIKGPMSVLYGTEAIGGIVNVLEEEKPAIGKRESDIGIRMSSNTLGGLLQAGIKGNTGKRWWRFRIAAENNADYSDGNNQRVLNSRFDGYDVKCSYGFQRRNWTSNTHLMSTFNRYGFIFNDIYTFVTADKRWSRKLDVNPAHLVLLNMISSENKFLWKNNRTLHFNIGVQSNERMENEGGGAISLNMHLFTFQYLLKYESKINGSNKLIISNLGSFEDNTNFGARKIVPDANMQESNIAVYLESKIKKSWIVENGISVGEKWIKTYFTATVNGPEKEVHPFQKFAPYYNAFSGFSYNPIDAINIKANVSTGVRIANLAELSSNGLHEGVFTYEIGDPHLKNEQIVAGNVLANYASDKISLSWSPFYNFFYNYIYLAPTAENWFGFPLYRYKQQDATQYGCELIAEYSPNAQIHTSITYAGMIGKTADGNYIPYTPAQKITPGCSYEEPMKSGKPIVVYTNVDLYASQKKVAPFELSTPAYALWNAGISTTLQKEGVEYQVGLHAHNILNANYYDHLSRFKNYGINNIGRNISLNLKIKFIRKNKS